ncbi:MAG: hypothetical protein RR382_00455 [Tannerellaceae bacterium]
MSTTPQDKPRTGPKALLDALQNLDLVALEKQARADLASGKVTKRPRAVAILNTLEGLKRNQVKPEDLMMREVPVIPPEYRPYSAAGTAFIPGDANVLYKDLHDVLSAYRDEKKVFGYDGVGASRLSVYDGVRAVYGFGDPVKDKSKQKDIQGLLKKVLGRTAKHSYWQSKLMSKPQDSTARSVITVDPDLGLDEVSLPWEMGIRTYSNHIHGELHKQGMKDAEIIQHLKDQDDIAKNALLKISRKPDPRKGDEGGIPVEISRSPAWHRQSFVGQYPRFHDGPHIATNPLIMSGMGGDFDGDTINVHVPAMPETIKEVKEKLMPSVNPWSDRKADTLVPLPKQEHIWGVYNAVSEPSKRSFSFATEQEALKAIERGEVRLSDDVQIGKPGSNAITPQQPAPTFVPLDRTSPSVETEPV